MLAKILFLTLTLNALVQCYLIVDLSNLEEHHADKRNRNSYLSAVDNMFRFSIIQKQKMRNRERTHELFTKLRDNQERLDKIEKLYERAILI